MNLKHLSDEQLNLSLKKLVEKEREDFNVILYHIVEVERRKLYLKMKYSNLYQYLSDEMGYTGGTGQRYKDAALLLRDVPELAEKMISGEINLSQVTLVQQTVRAKRGKVSREQKQKLVREISGKTVAGSQQIVSRALDIKIKESVKTTKQKDGSVRLEVTFTQEQWETMTELQEMLSTSLPHGNWDEVLVTAAKKVIKKKTTVRKTPIPSAYISESIRKFILQRDKCCQDCGSKWNLHVDHIIPVWAGGTNDLANLRALCANHNRQRYREQTHVRSI